MSPFAVNSSPLSVYGSVKFFGARTSGKNMFRLKHWFSTRETRHPEGSWIIFGEVTSRYFMYTAVLHSLYSSFCGGRWVIMDCYNGSLYKKVEKHWFKGIRLSGVCKQLRLA